MEVQGTVSKASHSRKDPRLQRASLESRCPRCLPWREEAAGPPLLPLPAAAWEHPTRLADGEAPGSQASLRALSPQPLSPPSQLPPRLGQSSLGPAGCWTAGEAITRGPGSGTPARPWVPRVSVWGCCLWRGIAHLSPPAGRGGRGSERRPSEALWHGLSAECAGM